MNILKKVVYNRLALNMKKRAKYVERLAKPLDNYSILIESRHGTAFEGNAFYIARHVLQNEKYSHFRIIVPFRPSREKLIDLQLSWLPKKVTKVRYASEEYFQALASSKYLINDTSFLHAFIKRDDQVYLNTWHGTPLKHLGRGVQEEVIKLGNVQRNFLCADYCLYPNDHTKNVIFDNYMLDSLFAGNVVMSGYPRNEVFFDSNIREEIKKRYRLNGLKCYAYMPTYRGINRNLHSDQFNELKKHLSILDKELKENERIFLNLHPFMEGSIDCESFEKIYKFPDSCPVYDFLCGMDGLITDYSSILFDFACSKKPIVLFAYDLEEYKNDRGTYFDLEKFPFSCVRSVHEVLPSMRRSVDNDRFSDKYADFIDEFCPYDNLHATEDLLSLILAPRIQRNEIPRQVKKPTCLVMVDGIDATKITDVLKRHFDDPHLEKYAYYVSFTRENDDAALIPEAIGQKINYYAISGKRVMSRKERLTERRFKQNKITVKDFCKIMKPVFEREWQRRYGNVVFDRVASLGAYNYINYMVAALGSSLTPQYIDLTMPGSFFSGVSMNILTKKEEELYRSVSDFRICNNSYLTKNVKLPRKHKGQSYALFCKRFVSDKNQGLGFYSLMMLKSQFPVELSSFRILINSIPYEAKIRPLFRRDDCFHGRVFAKVSFFVPYSELSHFSIHNYMKAAFVYDNQVFEEKAIRFSLFKSRYKALHGKYLISHQHGLTSFFRETRKGNIALTVRNLNTTDKLSNRLKLNFAWFLSQLTAFYKPESLILLFEKNASKYEEGAKVVYEYLCDNRNYNARFVLDRATFDTLSKLSPQYKKGLIVSHTLKHYFLFFKSEVFIGTETLAHCIELRAQNKHVQRKLKDSNIKYVFLQHGPTYMVSLDSPQRTFFRRSEVKGEMLIAINSELEKRHFVDLGGFDSNDLLLSGMPKFDASYQNPDADKIVIMPTWRAWEFNEIRANPKETKYWKMIERIKNAIPSELEDKIVVKTHPLFDVNNSGTIKQSESIDALLRETNLLITDYSSVAYDAFYRGANVIFYWEEKDECMRNYGEPTHLMIDSDTAPGYVCWNPDWLSVLVKKAYGKPQPKDHVEKFNKIVSFHDGKNTERLITMIEDRGLL